ncbi:MULTISPECIES: phage tail protein [unclassified Pseudomonas]|uniref:phage tail protein n=1 Tax=unclassified Pseudomonas TaxID=196821 RepID=UPI0008765596|nr:MULTISPECIES: phage tail protein [unclassified Pseudomonas]SCZ24899.1 Phage tail-collar fibre protein [Pseudomonas sp. NFACC44-2]SDA65849.1 Phage tail-collar fibre protein [Pseudomonas sp. NFACC51]SEI95235.1 Phage tail-collar fibre protein [Pseudomonas sp. NFACC07-1]SFI44004.1 Phage tail-collar fibre protein [Pseudomonas sp. NFACC54]SFS54898.1 Phage tail-collar fibre protein [Pseudomonas sp. NFACC48-1]
MADYYTLLTDAGIAYETACKAAGTPIKLSQISVGDGGGEVYNPAATATALKREVWRGPLNALFQDEKNPSWLLAEVTIPPEVGGWYVREAGIWTDTGILYAIVKYPESFKPVLATSGSGKEFYIRAIFETSNAELVTLLIDDTVVKATRAWVASYVADELAKLDRKQSVRVATTGNIVLSGAQAIDGIAVIAGNRVLVKSQTLAKDNGIYVAANDAWVRAKDADASAEVTSGLIVSVEEGATLANTIWQLVTDGAIVLGTTGLVFQNITQGFAPLNSPVLVNPTANTPPLFDNTKSIATTEYVMRASGSYRGFTSLTATTTLTASAVGTLVTAIGSFSITLPPVNSLPAGGAIHFRNIGSGIVTVVCVDADNINSGAGQITSIDLQVGATLELTGNGASAWWAGGTAQLQYSRIFGSTAAQFDSSLRLVNAAFAKRMGVEYSVFVPLTASSALGASSIGGIISAISPTPISITLPPTAGVAEGATIEIVATGSGAVTVLASGGDVLASPVATGITVVLGMGDNAEFVKVSTTWRLRGGSLALKYAASFAALFGSAGYQKLPDGLVLQWGAGTTSTGGTATIALPITFPTAVMKVLVSASGTNSVPTVGVVATNSVGINCFNGSTGAGKSENVQFLAIGY